MEPKSLLSRFKQDSNGYVIDPYGKPDFTPNGANKLTQAVNGLPTAFGVAGRPLITFGEIYKDVAHTVFGMVKIDPRKIQNNLQYASILFHEYRHAWQYESGNYYFWSNKYNPAFVENYQERDAYWFQYQMGAGSYFEGYSRYIDYRNLTKNITYK